MTLPKLHPGRLAGDKDAVARFGHVLDSSDSVISLGFWPGDRLAGWDIASFTSNWCPTPSQLRQLHATASVDFERPIASA